MQQQQEEALAKNQARPEGAAAGFPLVLLGRRASQNIPPGSAGVLLGANRDGAISVEEAKALPRPEASASDSRQAARRTIQELMGRSGPQTVVGFYRTENTDQAPVGHLDEALFERFFPDTPAVFLLITRRSVGLFLWSDGSLQPAAEPCPAAEPDHEAEHRARRSRWFGTLLALAVAVIGVGAVLELPGPAAPPPRAAVPSAPPAAAPSARPAPALSPPPPAAESPQAVPTPPSPAQAGPKTARGFLAHWAEAEQSGDLQAFLDCYAPHLEGYFDTRHSTRADVRDRAMRLLGRYGRPVTVRLANVSITPEGSGRARARLRVYWHRIAGDRTYAGQDRERLELVRQNGRWEIVAEQ